MLAISSGGTDAFEPEIGDLGIISTTKESISFEAKMNFTNPTEYSASVPYVNIHILNNNTILGYAIAKDVSVKPGKNDDILIQALWDPSTLGGDNGTLIGRELLSRYISGNLGVNLFLNTSNDIRLEHNVDSKDSQWYHTIATNAWKGSVFY